MDRELSTWLGVSFIARIILDKIKHFSAGFDSLFFLAMALLAYGVPTLIGGNGFLSAYIVGILPLRTYSRSWCPRE